MDDMLEPSVGAPAKRRRRTALLAGAAALLLSAPLGMVLRRRKAAVPDQDEGFKPIAEISGLARDATRVRLAQPKPKPELASTISLPTFSPPPPRARTEPAMKKTLPAPRRLAAKTKKKRARPAAAKTQAKTAAPPIFARSEDFFDLDFPMPARGPETAAAPLKQRPPSALEPVAVPDPLELSATKDDATAPSRAGSPAVIVERVPSN